MMPFGFCNASATFKRIIDTILADFTWKICLSYLNNVIIYGKTFVKKDSKLKWKMLFLREADLFMRS